MTVNFKLKALSATAAAGMMAMAGAASAQSVTGAGATLPQPLYEDLFGLDGTSKEVIGTWSYAGGGSGSGKSRFLTTTNTVNFAGSDSALVGGAGSELETYNNNRRAAWGPLIQVPVVATPVLLPYRATNVTTLNLTTEQLCKIFSFDSTARRWNQITTAEDDGGVGTASAIAVVYRNEGSGTTELLSQFLKAACGPYLPSGKSFTISNTFKTVVASALPTLTAAQDANGDGIPDVWVGASGSSGVKTALATNQRLGYLSPDPDYTGSSNSVVARINTFQPTAASIQAALPAPPAAADRADPLKWIPAYTYTASAYPIFGTTNLLVGQCYVNGYGNTTIGGAIKDFLTKLNNGSYDSKIAAHNFVKLPAAWNTAINQAFLTSTSSLSIGYASVCNGKGRPS